MSSRTRKIQHTLAFATLVIAAGAVGAHGDLLTDQSGRTLYVSSEDVPGSGRSVCDDLCLRRWPAVPANGAAGADFGSITRADGTPQLSYRGRPVHYYRYDHKPGDARGDGIRGFWQALRRTAPALRNDDRAPAAASFAGK
jgi:predicted lipoprotein with Yx(FWY)xxD motif